MDIKRKSIFNNSAKSQSRQFFIPVTLFGCLLLCPLLGNAQTDSLKSDTALCLAEGDSLRVGKDALKSKVSYTASDSIYFDLPGKTVHLWGNANMNYEQIQLKSAYAKINFSDNTLHAFPMTDSLGRAYGKADFKDGDKSYISDKLAYNFKTKRGRISGLATKEGDGIVYCEEVKKDPDDNLYGQNARYSTCIDTLNPHFHIRVKKLKIIPKKQIVSGPAQLMVLDVPTPAFIPFAFFPLMQGQKRGIIIPTYGYSLGYGHFLRGAGYYLPLGHFMDLKLMSDIYANGSWGGRVASQYVKLYKFSGNFNFEYNNLFTGDKDVPSEFQQNKSFRISWLHNVNATAKPGTTFNLNINAQSSSYNRTVPGLGFNDITQNTLASNVNYGKVFGKGRYSLTAALRHSQNTQTRDVSLSLPDVAFNVNSFSPFARKVQVGELRWYENIRIGYNSHLLNQINVKDENLLSPTIADSIKNGISHNIPIQLPQVKVLKYFFLTPLLNYNEWWYSQKIEKQYDLNSGKVLSNSQPAFGRAYQYGGSAQLSTRVFGFFNINKFNLMALRHTITPSLSLNYTPDFGGDKYGFYEFYRKDSSLKYPERYYIYEGSPVGGTSSGAVGSIGYNIGNNFELKYKKKTNDTARTVEKMSIIDNLNFNGNYNFLAAKNKLSNMTMSGSTTLFKKVSLAFGGQADPYQYIGGRRTDTLLFKKHKWHAGNMTAANLSMGTSFNSQEFKKAKKVSDYGSETERKMVEANPIDYVNFEIPWTLSINYILYYNQTPGLAKTMQQNVQFRGELTLTQKWKLGLSSGYDIENRNLTTTEITIHRDLHCWEMNFSWVPVGPVQRYMFSIKAKSALLQDLKLNKRRENWDR